MMRTPLGAAGGVGAACDTVSAWPPSVSVAVRAPPLLAATVTITARVPVPPVGLSVAQPALLVAVQPQLGRFVVTVTLPLPPAEPYD
jgi:hypothetical protein